MKTSLPIESNEHPARASIISKKRSLSRLEMFYIKERLAIIVLSIKYTSTSIQESIEFQIPDSKGGKVHRSSRLFVRNSL